LPRLAIKTDTVRSLFAKSGNQCAFPGCKSELIDEENDFIAQVCHIAAASEGGERFDPLMSDEERRAFDNLLVLCYPHHVKTNDAQRFSMDILTEMKRRHEERCSKTPYDAPEKTVQLIMKDQLDFSEEISNISHERVKQLEVNLGVFLDEDPQSHTYEIEKGVNYIEDLLEKIDTFFTSIADTNGDGRSQFSDSVEKTQESLDFQSFPLQGVLWEERNIGGANSLQSIRINLLSLSLHAENGRLLANPTDENTRMRVDQIRMRLRDEAGSAILVD
jgi:hypothetical protein